MTMYHVTAYLAPASISALPRREAALLHVIVGVICRRRASGSCIEGRRGRRNGGAKSFIALHRQLHRPLFALRARLAVDYRLAAHLAAARQKSNAADSARTGAAKAISACSAKAARPHQESRRKYLKMTK